MSQQGEFFVAEGDTGHVEQILNNFQPREVLFEKRKSDLFSEKFGSRFYTYRLDDWIFTPDTANDRLLKQFGTNSLKGFGVQGLPYGIIAAGAILYYLDMTCHENLGHINQLSRGLKKRSMYGLTGSQFVTLSSSIHRTREQRR
ncbi:MAG: hypothetical protein MZV63_57020 [Marinilabiliales bacterium]|nr:hypothetical protein [Marinilabiliales bacterium]